MQRAGRKTGPFCLPDLGPEQPQHADRRKDDPGAQRHVHQPLFLKPQRRREGHRRSRGQAIKPAHARRAGLRQHPAHQRPADPLPRQAGVRHDLSDMARSRPLSVFRHARRALCPAAGPKDVALRALDRPIGARDRQLRSGAGNQGNRRGADRVRIIRCQRARRAAGQHGVDGSKICSGQGTKGKQRSHATGHGTGV